MLKSPLPSMDLVPPHATAAASSQNAPSGTKRYSTVFKPKLFRVRNCCLIHSTSRRVVLCAASFFRSTGNGVQVSNWREFHLLECNSCFVAPPVGFARSVVSHRSPCATLASARAIVRRAARQARNARVRFIRFMGIAGSSLAVVRWRRHM